MAEANNIPIVTVKQPYKTNNGTTLYMGTSTEVRRDANGKYIPGSAVTSLRLYDTTFSPLGTDYKTVATREAGKPWNLTRDGNGNYVAGADLRQTLATPNSSLNTNLNNHVSGALGAPLQGVPARQVNPNTKQDVERALGTNPNTAQDQPNGAPSILGSPQGGNPAPTLREEPNTGVEPNENNIQNDVLVNGQLEIARPYIQYPEKMTLSQPKIKFQALKYRRSGENGQIDRENNATITNPLEFKFGNAQFSPADGPVYISIQSSISDQNSVDWGPDSVNAIDSAVYKASYDLMQSNSSDQLSSKLQGYMGDAQTQLRKYSDRTRRYLAGQAASINNVLARTDGVILNPNLELLFQGPQLRPFSFQLKLSARNIDEAAIVKKIIKYFKYHMASRQEKGLFLRSPNVFGIEYLSTLKSSHSGLNRIKECALTNFSVDYTPLGSYMSYYDDTMVAYTLNLQFQELTPIYDTNYTKADTIGF